MRARRAIPGRAKWSFEAERLREALNKLLRRPLAASRAHSLLAYLADMSRRSLRGSLRPGMLATLIQSFLRPLTADSAQVVSAGVPAA